MERIVFLEESFPEQYIKVSVCGDIDDLMLYALEEFVKHQRKRREEKEHDQG